MPLCRSLAATVCCRRGCCSCSFVQTALCLCARKPQVGARCPQAYPPADALAPPLHPLPPSAMPEVAYTQTAFSSATIDGVDYTYNFTTALPTNVT